MSPLSGRCHCCRRRGARRSSPWRRERQTEAGHHFERVLPASSNPSMAPDPTKRTNLPSEIAAIHTPGNSVDSGDVRPRHDSVVPLPPTVTSFSARTPVGETVQQGANARLSPSASWGRLAVWSSKFRVARSNSEIGPALMELVDHRIIRGARSVSDQEGSGRFFEAFEFADIDASKVRMRPSSTRRNDRLLLNFAINLSLNSRNLYSMPGLVTPGAVGHLRSPRPGRQHLRRGRDRNFQRALHRNDERVTNRNGIAGDHGVRQLWRWMETRARALLAPDDVASALSR